jgi:hypothetical protein
MKVSLIYAAKPTYGGWPSYTAHLALQLTERGHEVALYKIGSRTENKTRDYGRGLRYQNVSIDALPMLPHPVFVAVDKDGIAAAQALKSRALYVVHDPTEMKPEFLEVLRCSPVVAIRRANVSLLKAKGVEAVFIQHPYQPFKRTPGLSRRWNAVAVSRIDWDKRTAVIAEANERLRPDMRVAVFGACNRMYEHHKLSKFPGWVTSYHGRFATNLDAAVRLCEQAHFMVDLSVIAGDGGGSQYTFLEAWNAGCHLIVNRAWMRPDEELVEGANCTSVADATELIEQLMRGPNRKVMSGGVASLAFHSSAVVGPLYERAIP